MLLSFKLIDNFSEFEPELRDSMHQLRYAIFVEYLKWGNGIRIENGKEYDDYDNDKAKYIIGIDRDNIVQASCRLIPTSCNYMLADKYPYAIVDGEIPNSDKIWEISRFCISNKIRKEKDGNGMTQLIIEIMKFGLKAGLTNFISLSTDGFIPAIKQCSAWIPKYLGPKTETGDDYSYALLFDVNQLVLEETIANHLK